MRDQGRDLSRRHLLAGLGAVGAGAAGITALPGAAYGQRGSAQEPYRIYQVLWRGETDAEHGFADYWKDRGIPVELIIRNCAQDVNRIPEFVEEIRSIRPDLVYTYGTTAIQGVAGRWENPETPEHIWDIPIIFNIVADPVAAGVVPSLDAPARNVTGAMFLVPLATQMNALQSVTTLRKIAVIYNAREANSVLGVEALQAWCTQNGVAFFGQPVMADEAGAPQAERLPETIALVAAEEPDFLYLPADNFLAANGPAVGRAALHHRLPTFASAEVFVREGGALLGVVSSYYNVGKLAGYKAEQILVEGVPPGDISVETLSRFSFLLNMTTAKALQFYPPLGVFKIAEVITS